MHITDSVTPEFDFNYLRVGRVILLINVKTLLSVWCVSAVFKVVSAVLQFGNMVFKKERNTDQAILPNNEGIAKSLENSGNWTTCHCHD